MNITDRLFNEVIDIPGLCGVGITRGQNYRAMIEAGHDAKTADQFSFSRMARRVDYPAHSQAFEIAVALGTGEFRGMGDYVAT